jgi:hypothetical protein
MKGERVQRVGEIFGRHNSAAGRCYPFPLAQKVYRANQRQRKNLVTEKKAVGGCPSAALFDQH